MISHRGHIIDEQTFGCNSFFGPAQKEIDKLIEEQHQEEMKTPMFRLQKLLLNEIEINNNLLQIQNELIKQSNEKESKQVEILTDENENSQKHIKLLEQQILESKKSEKRAKINFYISILVAIIAIIVPIIIALV